MQIKPLPHSIIHLWPSLSIQLYNAKQRLRKVFPLNLQRPLVISSTLRKIWNCTTNELVVPPFRVSRKEEFSFTDITRSIKIRYVACYVMVKEWAGAKQQKDTGRIVSPPTGETTWDALRVYIYSTDTKLNLARSLSRWRRYLDTTSEAMILHLGVPATLTYIASSYCRVFAHQTQ